jgi:hypothetical protein
MSGSYSAFVSAGAVVLLSPDMTVQERQDVLNSTLFAQLVADKKYPGSRNANGWYERYQEVLKDSWLQRTAAWHDWSLKADSNLTVADWVNNQLAQSVPQTVLSPAVQTLNIVAELPDAHPAIELLQKHVLKNSEEHPSKSTFGCQVSVLVILAQRGPTLNSVYLAFESAASVASNPLKQVLSLDNVKGNIVLKRLQAELSDALYRPVRERIVKKMGDKASQNILEVLEPAKNESPPSSEAT